MTSGQCETLLVVNFCFLAYGIPPGPGKIDLPHDDRVALWGGSGTGDLGDGDYDRK